MNENEEKFKVDTENLKNETVETAKKVKESVKGVNIKEETKHTKGFVTEMFKKPLEKIKEVAEDDSGKYFKTALFLLVIWVLAIFIESSYSTISLWGFARAFKNILNVIKKIAAPIIGILVYAVIALLLNKDNKKSLTTIISTVTVCYLPTIIASVVSLLTLISSNISRITVPFSNLCFAVSIVLSYFGFKSVFGNKEDNEFIKKFVLIQALYQVAYIVIRLLGIYI